MPVVRLFTCAVVCWQFSTKGATIIHRPITALVQLIQKRPSGRVKRRVARSISAAPAIVLFQLIKSSVYLSSHGAANSHAPKRMFAPLAQRICDRSAALNGSGLGLFSFAFILRLRRDAVVLVRAGLGKRVSPSNRGHVDLDFGAILIGRFRTCRDQASRRHRLSMNENRRQVVDALIQRRLRIRRGTNPPWRTCATNSRNAGGIKGISSSV